MDDGSQMSDDVDRFEDLLEHLGIGRWTFLNVFILIGWASMPSPQALGAGFIAPLVNFTCVLPDEDDLEENPPDRHVLDILDVEDEFSALNHSGNGNYSVSLRDECSYLAASPGEWRMKPCTKWDFDNSTFTTTITSEMELVCDRAFMVPLYQSFYMTGALAGAWLGGMLSDKFGRRPIIVASTFVLVSTGTCSSWLPNIYLIFVARFLLGFCHMAGKGAIFGLVMETVPPRKRAAIGLCSGVGWGLTIAALGGLGYVVRGWRRLQLLISVPCVILIPAVLLMDESPRWLIVHGHKRAAFRVLTRVAAWHRVPALPVNRINSMMDKILLKKICDTKADKKLSVTDHLKDRAKELGALVTTPRMRQLTLVVCLDFFTASLVYFSVGLGATNFKSDPYIYMALGGIIDTIANLVIAIIVDRVGRRTPAITCFLVTGIILIGTYFIPKDATIATLAMVLVGRLTINAVFSEMYLYASEIFPTEIRLQGLGTGLFISRIGSIVSPFINDLLTPIFPWAMTAVAGGAALLAGMASFYLPETKDAEMPDHVIDVEENPQYVRRG